MPASTAQPQRPDLSPFAQSLAARIGRDGSMPLADFMGQAAQEYYASQHVFGRGGDFTTAPEISQLFGEMIALWLTDLWLRMGRPEHVQLIELGPGRGTLSADIMRTIKAWPDFSNAVTLHLVETSPKLRDAQARALNTYRPAWYDRIEDIPNALSFIVANEFLDALPIHQFEKTADGWMERYVDFDSVTGRFVFTLKSMPEGVLTPQDFVGAEIGSIFEISPASLAVMDSIGHRLRSCGGAALIIDYGHDHTGLGETLQALEKHAYADALQNPGGRDITAHVDFMTCAMAAGEDIDVHGPVTQGAFLQHMGIAARAEMLGTSADQAAQSELAAGLARLVEPAQMGRIFKVMGLTAQTAHLTPAGFSDDTGGEEGDAHG